MAKNFTTEYECYDCGAVYKTPAEAERCCTDYSEVYRCEVCRTVHFLADMANRCCQRREVPVNVVEQDRTTMTVRELPNNIQHSVLVRFVVSKPQPDCEYCGIAQTLGTVVGCVCMK